MRRREREVKGKFNMLDGKGISDDTALIIQSRFEALKRYSKVNLIRPVCNENIKLE